MNTPLTDQWAFDKGPDSPDYKANGMYVYADFARDLEVESARLRDSLRRSVMLLDNYEDSPRWQSDFLKAHLKSARALLAKLEGRG